jgi:hypothetical protein
VVVGFVAFTVFWHVSTEVDSSDSMQGTDVNVLLCKGRGLSGSSQCPESPVKMCRNKAQVCHSIQKEGVFEMP